MKVVFLVGPTASGKTRISLELANKLHAEIISCDSMCVYKGMDIITSKPAKSDMKKARHHLIDIIPPTKEFSVAEYRKSAIDAMEDILGRDKTALFVGGSGLYVKAVVDGLFPSADKDPVFRKAQENLAVKYGNIYLHEKLKKIDPASAEKIHPNNLRRVIRALEIYHTEKKRPSELKKETEGLPHEFRIIGLDIERERLYANIDDRVEDMFRQGLVREVKRLSGKKLSVTAKGALGYGEVLGYLKGQYSLEEAKELLKKNTRHFAKRQMTWFRRDSRIRWISICHCERSEASGLAARRAISEIALSLRSSQ
ncbi:MAG: tRNA (adenosine(37)-N6)-dimethylallyltransferase MiaA [Candidatus Omnitrophica bacterium]|nr:tRNA (adenosine(37)-N6)-dimethylallyltransferase MiaA [Candidatus Omnitrophota bacterium]